MATAAFLHDLQRSQAARAARIDPSRTDASFKLLSKALQYLDQHGARSREC